MYIEEYQTILTEKIAFIHDFLQITVYVLLPQSQLTTTTNISTLITSMSIVCQIYLTPSEPQIIPVKPILEIQTFYFG